MKYIIIGALMFAIGIWLLVHMEPETKYAFCPQPDITAYQVARIINEQAKAAIDPELRRHLCEVK